MKQLLIIGGSDAGISAALRSKEINPSIKAVVIIADRYPNFSICGLPFYLSGEVSDWNTLAHRTADAIEKKGVRLLLGHRAVSINPQAKTVKVKNNNGITRMLQYDKLIIGSGASPFRPPLAGLDLPGVFTLRWMRDGFAIREYMEEHRPKAAVILGSGYIGMEMADALTRKGLSVTVLARSGRVLKTVDLEMGDIIRKELSQHDVRVIDGIAVTGIEKHKGELVVRNPKSIPVKGDLLLVAAGGRPETSFAAEAGIAIGLHGAIRVNRAMETNIEDIYAAGDCVETWHRLLKKYTYLPLGTTSHKQGRVAGENAAGGEAEFAGSLGTQVVKIFDLVVARTGLGQAEAKTAGFEPRSTDLETWDHKAYYPGATPLRIRITGDGKTHRLLGAQMIGHYGAEVSKRIDIFATAIFNKMTVESLINLDLSYTPPLSTPWDPVQMASQAWVKEVI
jgi:NADPH-dependent 2,4-dienoyl-CoA reductase/sulfur reductase-like enzyme